VSSNRSVLLKLLLVRNSMRLSPQLTSKFSALKVIILLEQKLPHGRTKLTGRGEQVLLHSGQVIALLAFTLSMRS
jgi:hypothetical protein